VYGGGDASKETNKTKATVNGEGEAGHTGNSSTTHNEGAAGKHREVTDISDTLKGTSTTTEKSRWEKAVRQILRKRESDNEPGERVRGDGQHWSKQHQNRQKRTGRALITKSKT